MESFRYTLLSKVFLCLSHELIIAKLNAVNAYGFTFPVLKLFHNYLSKIQQRTKINRIYLVKVTNRNTRIKVWNMFKVNNKNTKTTPMASFWCFYWELWTYFTPCSSVFIVNFENVIADWDLIYNIAWYILFTI